MLRKLILASASLLALAAAPVTANAQSPYGFYVGVAGGGVSASADTSALGVPGFGSTDLGMKGFTGGGYAGFGITSSGIYTGIEAQYDFGNGEHNTVLPGFGPLSIGRDHTFGGAGRIGYAFDKETMVFGKVGYAFSHYTAKDVFAGISEKKWQGGLKVGVGVERVHRHRLGMAAFVPNAAGDAFEPCRRPPGQHDMGAVPPECLGDRAAHRAAAAIDHGHLVPQHPILPPRRGKDDRGTGIPTGLPVGCSDRRFRTGRKAGRSARWTGHCRRRRRCS